MPQEERHKIALAAWWKQQQIPLLNIAFFARALHLFAQSAATLTRANFPPIAQREGPSLLCSIFFELNVCIE
jgi:hypothetical protein